MAEQREVRIPDLGGATDVDVIELAVAVGSRVEENDTLLTLEGDKATMDVPAPCAGILREYTVKVGDKVSQGSLIARIEVDAAAATSDRAPSSTEAQASAEPEPRAAPVPAHSLGAAPTAVAPAVSSAPANRPPPVPFDASVSLPAKAPHASPAVRLFARELGVDLAEVRGSGRKGRITREDVQAHVKQVMSGAARTGAGTGAATSGGAGLNLLPWPKVDFAKFGPVEQRPLSRIKKLSGANLARNWVMIPHVTQFDEADITEMEAFRKAIGQQHKDVKITPLVFLIKAVVAALRAYPEFNASLDESGENLVLKKYFHIGVAVDTPDGLVVPVLRDCDQKGLIELARELAEVSARARDKKLAPADMQGGCFSISSLGGIGGTAFTPIINAPEVAILGVSRASQKPIWNGSAFAPRLILPLSLSYDHRVIDGAAAARFTSFLAQVLGDIRRLLL